MAISVLAMVTIGAQADPVGPLRAGDDGEARLMHGGNGDQETGAGRDEGSAGAVGLDQPRQHQGPTSARTPWWGEGFAVVRRGYDQAQVEEALDRAEADYRVVMADRDELARTMDRAREEIEGLRAEVGRLAAAPISGEDLSERLGHMLALAQQETATLRSEAAAQARAVGEQARNRARATVAAATQHAHQIGERAEALARQRAADAEEQAWQVLSEATRQAQELRKAIEEAAAEAEQRRRAMTDEQHELLERARSDAERIAREADADQTRRDQNAAARRRQLEHDFETAMTARRAEATAALAEAEKLRRRAEDERRDAAADAAARLAAATAAVADLEQRRRRIADHIAALGRAVAELPPTNPSATYPASIPAPTSSPENAERAEAPRAEKPGVAADVKHAS